MRPLVALAAASLLTAAPARADFITVPLDGLTTLDLRTLTNGANYPVAPTSLTVGGVPFALAPVAGVPGSLGALGTDAPVGGVPVSFTLTVDILHPLTGYTLINSGFGTLGANNGSLAFATAGGLSATFDLIQGANVRDHFNGFYNNQIDPGTATANFPGDVRLDRQRFDLPAAFAADRLTSITLTGPSGSNFIDGLPFLAGATVQTPSAPPAVPAPASVLLLLAAAPAGWLARRRAGG